MKRHALGATFVLLTVLTVAMLTFVGVSVAGAQANGQCCMCLNSCSDAFTSQDACIQHCLANNDTFINFDYPNVGQSCSAYPGCVSGACCNNLEPGASGPACRETIVIGCSPWEEPFLVGQPCSACPRCVPTLSEWGIAAGAAIFAVGISAMVVRRRLKGER